MVGGAIIEINKLASVDALKPVWTALAAGADASFFLSWPWVETWLETTGARPLVVTATCGGAIVALALVQESRRRRYGVVPIRVGALHETGDAQMDSLYIEYNGILRDRRAPDSLLADCLRAMMAHESGWDEIRLSAIAPDLAAAADATGWIVQRRAASRCYAVDLRAVRAAGRPYIDGLGANTRRQLQRARRLYAQLGPVRLEAASSLEAAKAALEELKALHQLSWRRRGRAGAFAVPFFGRFHDRLLDRIWPQGGAEVLKIAAGAHVIGYLYNFIHRGVVHNYQSGFAQAADNRFKPGLLSHALCVERHLAGTALRYDLMAGEARYKQSLASPHADLVWLTLQRPGLLARLDRAARALKRALAK